MALPPALGAAACLSQCLRWGTCTENVSVSNKTGASGLGSPVKMEKHAPLLPAKVARGTGPLEVGGESSAYLVLLPWLHSPLI